MLIDRHATACRRAAPSLPLNLQQQILELHRVIFADYSFGLNRRDAVEVLPQTWHKGEVV